MRLSPTQTNVMATLRREPGRYICRHGYSFRLCLPDGRYLETVRTPTVRALVDAKQLKVRHGCPNAMRREQDMSWWPVEEGAETP